MHRWLNQANHFFELPLSLRSRVLILCAVAVLIVALFFPLWRMTFVSNQYLDGLTLHIYASQLKGGVTPNRDDLREINALNHYIGMRPLLESDFSEFVWIPFVIGLLGVLALRALVLGKMAGLVDVFVLFSYLPQRVAFPDNLTAREVLNFYAHLRQLAPTRVNEILSSERFHFNGFASKAISEFSGGMIQRLGLAVACLPDAPILLLDEPTVSLDPAGAIHFRAFLQTLKQAGKTIVFTSHMLADVEQLADRVAILVGASWSR